MREDRDLKQRQVAQILAVAQTTYSDYERGKISIPVNVLIKLADLYGTSVDYLLGLTDSIMPYPTRKTRNRSDHTDWGVK